MMSADPDSLSPPAIGRRPSAKAGDRPKDRAGGSSPIELSTAVSNLRHLRESDLGPYDAVYLGNVFCRLYEANLLERPAELREAIRRVRSLGKRPRLTTYAATRNDTLPVLRRALEVAAEEVVDAVEIHALGLLTLAREACPGVALHVGSLAGVYTDAALEALASLGVARVAPSHEMALDEIDAMAAAGSIPLELPVHGKVSLGVSDSCILLEHATAWGVRCPDLCQQEVFLRREDWALKSVGTGILSGRDVCLLEHLPRLLAAGHRHFRIEAVSESPAYRAEVGAVYREALACALAGDGTIEPRWWDTLRRHAPVGFCNGFAFGTSGMDYLAAEPAPSGALASD
jgi:putative protease